MAHLPSGSTANNLAIMENTTAYYGFSKDAYVNGPEITNGGDVRFYSYILSKGKFYQYSVKNGLNDLSSAIMTTTLSLILR